MVKVEDPVELRKVLLRLALNGVNGVLISGGFNNEGYLDVEPFLNVIKWFKRTFNTVVSIHVGLPPRGVLDKLVDVEVDVIDYEFTLDPTYIKKLRGLKREPADYVATLDDMIERGLCVTPHIPLGFTENRDWVYEAIELLNERKLEIAVFVVNMHISPSSSVDEFKWILSYARGRFNGEICLGCMRPMWFKKTLDIELTAEGLVDRIVNPYFRAMKVYETCCSIPRRILRKLKG